MPEIEMLWIDLETTGLNAQTEVPLELGLAVTDRYGNIAFQNSWTIDEDTIQYRSAKENCIDLVKEMHTKSGLWNDLEKDDFLYSRKVVDQQAIDWLDSIHVPHGSLPMCGSSIGSLDRPFVQAHLPKLQQHFHYRNIDVSSIQEIAKLLNKPVWEARPDSSDATHRVLADIDSSIQMYRFWYTEFLMMGDDEWHSFLT